MDKNKLLELANELISEAETGKAIDLVEEFLKKEPKYKLLYREAVQLSSQFNKIKRDEEKGTISFENAKLSYNQVSDSLLNLLEYIESDDFKPAALSPQPKTGLQAVYQSHRLLFLLGLPGVVLSVVLLILVFRNGGNNNIVTPPNIIVNQPNSQADECLVRFPDTTLNILLLPFFRPSGDPIQVEGLIMERLQEVSERLRLKTEVGLCTNYKPLVLLNYPEADSIGRRNKAGLIIWGRAEKGKDFNVIKTRFKYLGNNDTIQFAKLKWQGEKLVTSDKVLSIITSQGELTEDIEATVMLALGLYAGQTGNNTAAMIAFQSANVVDSSALLMKNMLLADAFIANKQPEKALSSLDTLLTTHPDYWLGRNNRAMLRIQTGDHLGAIEDLSVALVKRPTDPDMLLARAAAFEQSNQLIPARSDYENFAKTNPERAGEVKAKLEITGEKIKRLEAVVKQTQAKPARELTKKDLITAADASRQLSDTKRTEQLVSKGLELSPRDPKLISIQIENLLKVKKTNEANKVLNDAIKQGVKKEEITRHSKVVKTFTEQGTAELER